MGASDLRATGARERILNAAYELFSAHGIGAVGIDTIIAAPYHVDAGFGSRLAVKLSTFARGQVGCPRHNALSVPV